MSTTSGAGGSACDAAGGSACDAAGGSACDAAGGSACDAAGGSACDAAGGSACDAAGESADKARSGEPGERAGRGQAEDPAAEGRSAGSSDEHADEHPEGLRSGRQRLAALRNGWPAALVAVAVAAVIAFVLIAGNDPAADRSRAVASYGEHELTLSDLSVLVGGTPDSAPPADQASAAAITTWLFTAAVAEELNARGGGISDAHRADAAIAAQTQGFTDGSVEHGYWSTAQAALTALSEFATERAEAQAFDIDIEYLCAAHVLTETEEAARTVKELADAGDDFGALAAEHSIEPAADPDGADSRGDLGCGPAERYVQDFTEGARTAQGSGIVGPIRTDFGWHVIQVRSMGPLDAGLHPELSEAEIGEAVESALQRAEADFASEVFADVLHEAAVRISAEATLDERFGTFDVDISGVVPPAPQP